MQPWLPSIVMIMHCLLREKQLGIYMPKTLASLPEGMPCMLMTVLLTSTKHNSIFWTTNAVGVLTDLFMRLAARVCIE